VVYNSECACSCSSKSEKKIDNKKNKEKEKRKQKTNKNESENRKKCKKKKNSGQPATLPHVSDMTLTNALRVNQEMPLINVSVLSAGHLELTLPWAI
jgi:sRNA-binding protein